MKLKIAAVTKTVENPGLYLSSITTDQSLPLLANLTKRVTACQLQSHLLSNNLNNTFQFLSVPQYSDSFPQSLMIFLSLQTLMPEYRSEYMFWHNLSWHSLFLNLRDLFDWFLSLLVYFLPHWQMIYHLSRNTNLSAQPLLKVSLCIRPLLFIIITHALGQIICCCLSYCCYADGLPIYILS